MCIRDRHKDNHPIRPVVSYVTAPSVKLSKRLIKIIQTQCKFQSTHSIKNSLDLINRALNQLNGVLNGMNACMSKFWVAFLYVR